MTGLSQRDRIGYALSAFNSIGIGKEAGFGILGGLAGESGRGLNTTAHNPNDPNGGSVGIGQWHSGRRKALEDFAKKSKYGIDDFRTQIDFIVHELQTSHKAVKNKLVGPNVTRAQAVKTWTQKYEIPAKKYEFLNKRTAYANQFAAAAAGIPVDTATPEELASIESAVESITGQSISLGLPDYPDIVNDVSLTGANLNNGAAAGNKKYAETPATGPVPGSRPGPVPGTRPDPNAPQAVASAAPTQNQFDWERFGPATGAVPPDSFDWGRMSVTPNAPSVSVATMDQTPVNKTDQLAANQPTSQPSSLDTFDMGRFGPVAPSQTSIGQASPTSPLGAAGYGPSVFDTARFGPAPAVQAINAQMAPAQAPSPLANAYVDPMVTTSAQTTPSGAGKTFATAPANAPTTVGGVVNGLGNAINGMFSDLTAAGKSLKQGDLTGAFKALPGGPTAATTSQTVAAEAQAKTQQPKGPVEGFLDADTSFGGFAGAMLGGYFGGPLGAIAGGLIGQGLNNAINKAPTTAEAQAKAAETNGMSGGIGRSIDNLLGGISNMFGGNSGNMDKDYFPDAPSPPSDRNVPAGTFSESDRQGARDWADAHPDASPGLW